MKALEAQCAQLLVFGAGRCGTKACSFKLPNLPSAQFKLCARLEQFPSSLDLESSKRLQATPRGQAATNAEATLTPSAEVVESVQYEWIM